MGIKQKIYMTNTLRRLLDKKLMGELFKVIFVFGAEMEIFRI